MSLTEALSEKICCGSAVCSDVVQFDVSGYLSK